jgi:hypothetical protein
MILKRKPRDLNPLHWIVTAQRLRHAIDDLDRAQENLRLLGSIEHRGRVHRVQRECRAALQEAERIARRLGA